MTEDASANLSASAPARVLLVCTANRGRSPIAEALLRRKLAARGLSQLVAVESAGLCAYELGRTGLEVGALVAAVSARHGLDLSVHRARPFGAKSFGSFDLIIVMEAWQAKAFYDAFQPKERNVFTLRQVAGETGDPNTPDVAGVPEAELEAYVAEAERCLDAALERGPLAALVARAQAGA
jgi:protein-tyrosine-phosphatase